jgi:hypothetical protein
MSETGAQPISRCFVRDNLSVVRQSRRHVLGVGLRLMTILVPATGERFKGELIEDGQSVLLVTEEKSTRYQLAVILKAGWRIVNATPAERAMLEAHGFGSGRIQ